MRVRSPWAAVVLSFVLIGSGGVAALAAVGDGAAAGGSSGLGACPKERPAPPRPDTRRIVLAVPRNPVAGELCVYGPRLPVGDVLRPWRAVLGPVQAQTLALLLRSPGTGASCDTDSPALVRLRYQGGVFSAVASGCKPELLAARAGAEPLSALGAAALEGLVTLPPPGRAKLVPSPDYVGQQLWPAALATHRQEFAVTVAEANDPQAPFGRVIWQTPLADSPVDASAGFFQFIVATRPALACRNNQLVARYFATTGVSQSNAGFFYLFDPSQQPCSVHGTLTFHGVDESGQPDTDTVTEHIGGSVDLSPLVSLRGLTSNPAGALVATFDFAGPAAAATGCARTTTPAAWTLTLTGGPVIRIPNRPTNAGAPFNSCYGNVNAFGSFELNAS